MTVDIINQLINQYTGSITNLQTGSIALGRELFNAIALISVAMLGLNHLLRKNVDMVDADIELIRWLIYLDFFYAFITNFSGIYSFVYSSIQQIGNYLGTRAAGKAVDISPSNIFNIGIALSLKILGSNITLNLFRNLLYPLVSVITAAVILFCFASIGLELILVQIGSQIILAGGIFLLAFSGFQWTRDYAERYVHTFFHVGIKIIFIYILVGLGVELAQGWSQVVINAPWQKVIDYDIAVCLSTYIYYKLCVKLPDQAVSWLTGRLAMGFDAAAEVKAVVRTMVKIPAAAAGAVAGIQGMSKAVSVANQVAKTTLESQGKKTNLENTEAEVIRTLGAAGKVEWEKKVDETKGGKLAKNILATIPKPKKVTRRSTKKDTKTDSNNDSTDYTI
jgi:type IV secretion system protein TrbL